MGDLFIYTVYQLATLWISTFYSKSMLDYYNCTVTELQNRLLMQLRNNPYSWRTNSSVCRDLTLLPLPHPRLLGSRFKEAALLPCVFFPRLHPLNKPFSIHQLQTHVLCAPMTPCAYHYHCM